MVENIHGKNLKEVIKQFKYSLVYFWADWCKPCKALSPVLNELEVQIGDKIKFFKLDVEEHPSTTGEYGIESVPTILVFKNGEPVTSLVGFNPKGDLEHEIISIMD